MSYSKEAIESHEAMLNRLEKKGYDKNELVEIMQSMPLKTRRMACAESLSIISEYGKKKGLPRREYERRMRIATEMHLVAYGLTNREFDLLPDIFPEWFS